MTAGGEVTAGYRRALSPLFVAVGLTALAGVVLRVWAYRLTIGTPNGDEAVVGLMTRHFLDGELTAFYWQRTEECFTDTPRRTTHAEGLGPRHTIQWVPRDLSPLIARLDALRLSHVYAEYWLAYRLNFDTEERIVAAHNAFVEVTLEDGQAVPKTLDPDRYPPYTEQVREARHGFVFYRPFADMIPIVPDLERFGYRRHDAGFYVIYAPGTG